MVLAFVLALAARPIPVARPAASPLAAHVVARDEAIHSASPPQLQWLREHAVKLKTVEAEIGFQDLLPLEAMIGDARIVGLGEGTHGTREHFQMKHRLFEFLASEMDFTIFSIEANMPEAYELDGYVLGGEGDVDRLIGGMYFWTWNTEEVRDLVEWMRRFNAKQAAAGSTKRVHFTGFDMQTGKVALRIATEFLEKHDPEFSEKVRADLDRLASYELRGSGSGSSGSFGCATGRFPVEEARGKKLRFTGWVRTENVDAWAGLWWRVDGPTMRFDNMQDRGPRGTSDWQELAIEMEIPADAQAIYFGLVMPGGGQAWFDALSIELDGARWSSPDFDLDFEAEQPKGIVAANPGRGAGSADYHAVRDQQVAKSGGSSMRVERVGAPVEGWKAADAEAAANSILDHMTEQRDGYAKSLGARTADWAIQNARVVVQWTQLADTAASFEHRDRSMAENAAWILAQDPNSKMVVWAHNWHVRDEEPWMGSHLRQKFGAQYVNLAFCSSHGEYYAMSADRSDDRLHELATPPEQSFEAILESAGEPLLLIDLRSAKSDDPGSSWLTEERPFGGIIGALEMKDHYRTTKLQGAFDLLIYTRDTTAARQLATSSRRK